MTALITDQKMPAHPRLFADAARFEALKTQSDEVTLQLKALLRSEAERHLSAPPLIYPPDGFLMAPMREVQGRILTLAMMYRLSGKKPYFEDARRELLQLAALPEWRPGHFLDVGEGTLAAAVGLDWLYDDLSPAEREQIAGAITRNALSPSLEVPVGGNSWLNCDFNWNSVCNAGLIAGALAIYEREPAIAAQVLERAIQSLPFVAATYAPDGAYAEGPSYWSYGTTFQVIAIEALRSGLGTSFDLERAPGFLQTTDFLAQMRAPSGEEFNFADYHSGETRSLSEPVLLWFARETQQRGAAREELQNLQTLFESARKTGIVPPLCRHLALGFLWWNPDLLPSNNAGNNVGNNADLPLELPLGWMAGGHLPLAVMRSAWNDENATYVALKGGTPHGSHAHMDAGSFVFEAGGVRWALDLGTENYNQMRAAKVDLWNYAPGSSRWMTFRNGPESHNILRFDNAPQDVAGFATVRALPGATGAVIELSSLYEPVETLTRTVQLHFQGCVSIEDRWKIGAREVANEVAEVEIAWQWLTKAKATHTARGFLLEQAGQALEIHIEASAPFTTEIEDISAPRNPQDSPNPGLKRLGIRLPGATNQEGHLTVRTILVAG